MARNYLCTLNLKEDQVQSWQEKLFFIFEKTGARYIVGQLERGHQNNTPHIQFYVNFNKVARITKITKVDKTIHCEKVLVNNGADRYCMKEDTRVEGPVEYGEKPVRRNVKTDWEEVWNKAKEGKIEDIPPQIRVMHYNKLKQINKDNLIFKDSDHLRGIWIYGKSGSGKSRWVRENCKDLYPKLCNASLSCSSSKTSSNLYWDVIINQSYLLLTAPPLVSRIQSYLSPHIFNC